MNKNNFRDVLLWNSREVILMVFSGYFFGGNIP